MASVELVLFLAWASFCCSRTDALSPPTWHVSPEGVDSQTCGHTVTSACATVGHAVGKAAVSDTVLIHGQGQSPTFYNECSDSRIRRSVALVGRGNVLVGCQSHETMLGYGHNRIFTLASDDGSQIAVNLTNIQFVNGYLFPLNAHVRVASCTLRNAAVYAVVPCDTVSLELTDSRIEVDISESLSRERPDKFDTSIYCENVRGRIRNSVIADVNLNFQANESNHVTIEDSLFTKRLQLETGMGGVNVTLPHRDGSVVVDNCTFEKLIHFNPISSSINIETSALRIESDHNDKLSAATVLIKDSTFADNERAVSLSRAFWDIAIIGCRFLRNAVMHAAAGIRLAIAEDNHVLVKDTVFDSNAAGYNKHESVPNQFEYDGFQLRITEKMVNGIISLVGKGGAVRIHRGNVTFDNCTFVNNTATLLGGAIYLAKNGTMYLENNYFENSLQGAHSMQGDVVYSVGMVIIKDNVFEIKTALNHVSILRHSGEPWSMNVKRLWFKCPVGHRLVMVNNTSHRVEPKVGLMRSNKLDQLYYYCETCGNNQYSIDQGFVNYSVKSDQSDHFFTLLINGTQPFSSHPIDYQYGNITCRECPYGGDCEGDIKSIANFWGYISDHQITFQHCPQDYCCGSTKCSGIDTCAAHKSGRLCGRCEAGYSGALFSENCVPNDTCQDHWVWWVLGVMGLVYTLFLMTQRDIQEVVSMWSSSLPDVCSGRRMVKEKLSVLFIRKNVEEREDGPYGNGAALTELVDDTGTTNQPPATSQKDDQAAGTLIILFYYFQDSLLLHVDTVYTKIVSRFVKRLKSFLVGLFRFRLDVFQFMDDICVYPDMQPVQKLLLKTLFVPYVLTILGVVFVLHKILRRVYNLCFCPNRRTDDEEDRGRKCSRFQFKTSFSCRLASGFTLAMLFTFQKMATATFALLNCVPVGNASVLFMDGATECFQPWQYGVMTFALVSVVPFCLVLMVGPPFLKNNTITVLDFCVGCIIPLPTLLFWLFKHIRRRMHDTETVTLAPEAQTIIGVLQGPFKDSTSKRITGQFCWAGVLVARRLILFICYTFINDVLVRLLCMLCVCFVILMHHMYIRPYKVKKANLAGALSAAALLIVGTINLLRACFEAAEYIPQGPYKFLMEISEEVENTLVLWLPLAGVCLILVAFLFKLISLLCGLVWKRESRLEYTITSTREPAREENTA